MAKEKTKAKATKKPAKAKSTKVTKAKSTAASKADVKGALDEAKMLMNSYLDDSISGIEKSMGLSATAFDPDEPRLSTGLISLDVLIGGGIVSGGWYTIFGGEQSCKSTLTMLILASIVKQGFDGKAAIWDYEGSTDPSYVENILKSAKVKQSLSSIFGEIDPETGDYIIQPLVRYISHDSGEDFFDYYNRLKRALPDKTKMGKGYYYVFPHEKKYIKMFKGAYDKEYLSKRNKIRIPAEDGMAQALALVDSYPAMLPALLDEDGGSKAIGSQARMFSDGIKRVKSGMRKKRMTIFGVNQLRLKPMVMFGSPEYEPGGEALRFYSDVRLKSTSRAIPPGWGKGQTMEEPSVEGKGSDEYRFIVIKVHKNKLGGFQYQDTWARMWLRDHEGQARGLDPVFDTWNFLKMQELVGGTRKNMKFVAPCPLEGAKKMTWDDFKVLILGKKQQVIDKCKEKEIKPVDIRLWCKKQVASGNSMKRFSDILAGSGDAVAEDDED